MKRLQKILVVEYLQVAIHGLPPGMSIEMSRRAEVQDKEQASVIHFEPWKEPESTLNYAQEFGHLAPSNDRTCSVATS